MCCLLRAAWCASPCSPPALTQCSLGDASGFVDVLVALNERAGSLKSGAGDALAADAQHVASDLLPALASGGGALKKAMFKFNTHMLMRTYASGAAPSLLDVALLAPLREQVAGYDGKQQGIMCNVTRWYNLAQVSANKEAKLADAALFEPLALLSDAPPPGLF